MTKPVCANCEGMIGDLAEGREPEELCDTCYKDSQQVSRRAWDDLFKEASDGLGQ